MLRNLYLKELRDQRWSLLLWSLSIIGYVVLMCAVYPSVGESQAALEDLLDSLPPAFKNYMMGQAGDFFTPSGYLGARLFALLSPLILLIFGVAVGGRTVSGEEDAGTMGVILAYPITRGAALLQKYLMVLTAAAAVAAAHLVGLLIGIAAVGMDVDVGRLLEASFSLWLLTVLGASLAFAAGAAGARRGTAIAVAAALLLITYLADTIGLLVKDLEWLRELSFFYYYGGGQVLNRGLDGVHVGVLLAVIAVCVAVAWPTFLRRDIRQ